jgi:hypothetical protein
MAYVPKVWSSSSVIAVSDIEHMQLQYDEIMTELEAHTHDDRYHTKEESDSYFWNADNDGPGSGLNADKLEGTEGADIESGLTPGIIGFWYGSLSSFSGKLLTGYPNWHIADGSDGSEDLSDIFPIGAYAVGSGYQVGASAGNTSIKPTASVLIANHILTIEEIMHRHKLTDRYPSGSGYGGGGSMGYTTYWPTGNYLGEGRETSTVGTGQGHNHDGVFTGRSSSLDPLYLALIPVQYGTYSGGVWAP